MGLKRVVEPHVHPRTWSRRATATITTASLALPRLRAVAYVRGAADRVPEALRQVGLPITLLGGAELGRGDLRRFDAIVIGPRAYETDPDLPGTISTTWAKVGAREANAASEDLHALDHQVYAQLQLPRDEAAKKLLESIYSIAMRTLFRIASVSLLIAAHAAVSGCSASSPIATCWR